MLLIGNKINIMKPKKKKRKMKRKKQNRKKKKKKKNRRRRSRRRMTKKKILFICRTYKEIYKRCFTCESWGTKYKSAALCCEFSACRQK